VASTVTVTPVVNLDEEVPMPLLQRTKWDWPEQGTETAHEITNRSKFFADFIFYNGDLPEVEAILDLFGIQSLGKKEPPVLDFGAYTVGISAG